MEIFRLVVMTVAIGYILSGFIPRLGFEKWSNAKMAIIVAAPGIVLHELAHKFVAILFGFQAEFFASYWGLGIGVFLKLISSPFIVFVPGYVSIAGASAAQQPIPYALIAFAGPFVNLLLWAGATIVVKTRNLTRNQMLIAFLTKKINGFLFLFNMIPLGFFDGAKVLDGIINAF